VVALHVHHGLNASADRWLEHGRALCLRWARRGRPVTFAATKLDRKPASGESVEAWARQARYRALRQMAVARGIDLVLLAHHRRDQAETFLLQALRGGGVAGLSAMPSSIRREGVTWARPWLAMPREAIEAYARRYRLVHVEDDSNDDPRFARNRLRLTVWPALTEAFPAAEAALAAAASRAQEATAILAETAEAELVATADPSSLHIAAWRALSPSRQGNLLRAWLRRATGRAPAASLVERLLCEVSESSSMRWPVEGGELRGYRGRLRYEPLADAGALRRSVIAAAADETAVTIDVSKPGSYVLPGWDGALEVRLVSTGGIPVARATRLEVRPRRPGDRFQAGAGRPPRSLKLQFQAAGLPAWERSGPLLCRDGVPVFVAGLGLDARAVAAPGEPQLALAWRVRR
jgi:tRNA(Ile)-lysidine synthase